MNPLIHFIKEGSKNLINPHPLIDMEYYVMNNPLIIFYGYEPLSHFILLGAQAGICPHPTMKSEYYSLVCGKKIKNIFKHYTESKNNIPLTPNFDTQYYLSQKPEMNKNEDPFLHYLRAGWKQGKNPSIYFDTKHYLQQAYKQMSYNDNPLSHFYKKGRLLGFTPTPHIESSHSSLETQTLDSEIKFLFLHIPKTAGTSLMHSLKNQFKNKIYRFEPDNVMLWNEKAYQDAFIKYSPHIQMLFGHFLFGLHRIFNQPTTYLTFLRHPVERIISLYQFQMKDRFSNLKRQGMGKMSLERILISQANGEFNNQMCHQISGILPPLRYENNKEVLEAALRNIENHFSFVGFYEEMGKSVKRLSEKFDWKKNKVPWLNKTPNSIRGDVLKNKKLVKLIEDANQLDIELYEKLKASFG